VTRAAGLFLAGAVEPVEGIRGGGGQQGLQVLAGDGDVPASVPVLAGRAVARPVLGDVVVVTPSLDKTLTVFVSGKKTTGGGAVLTGRTRRARPSG
jgi:hypothetical protein